MTERFRLSAGEIPTELLEHALVFDTNVWLFINGPFIDIKDPRHRVYSALYSQALKAGARICLPQIVMSEFVRQSLHQYIVSEGGEKPRKIHHHEKYSSWMNDISDELFHILDSCELIDDGFSGLDLDACIKQASTDQIDFNDAMLAGLCSQHGMVLVTDDGDYLNSRVSIASSNKRLLVR